MGDGPILILGASGFLGPHLVAAALGGGAPVVAASRVTAGAARLPARTARLPARVARLHGRAAEPRAWDGTRAGDTERLLEELSPRAVVLAAALSRVEPCERDPALARALNAALPELVARACRARGLRLVHLSTDLVFGANPPRAGGFREEDPPAPVHVYGRSKAEGEERVLAAHPAALVLRLPLLYGDSLGRVLGATDQILAALERGERPALFRDEWRTPLEAGNAARAVLELAAGAERGLLHLAGPERLSRHELGLALLAARGMPSDRVRAALRTDLGLDGLRPRDVSLDGSRARGLLATALLAPREALEASRVRDLEG